MWVLQTPGTASEKLLKVIGEAAANSLRGGAAFAFASAAGVKLLEADEGFRACLKAGEFTLVVGLDAITDTAALNELTKMAGTYANFRPLAFLHALPNSLFHPKTLWFKKEQGGTVIAGSGNLTAGGLNSNWEAASMLALVEDNFTAYEDAWNDWLNEHEASLLPLDDQKVIARAKLNKIQRAKIKKVLATAAEQEGDAALDVTAEAVNELGDVQVLIAEIPKSGDRWKQVNFNVDTYQNYFGVTIAAGKDVVFRNVLDDGTLGPVENRHGVAVASKNYRFEVGAIGNTSYPASGIPIVVFQRIADDLYYYILLLPDSDGHAIVAKYLDDNVVKIGNKLRRVVINAATLNALWPSSPFFL